jgi:hypothetical protein
MRRTQPHPGPCRPGRLAADRRARAAAGAVPLGVATGIYSRAELEAVAPGVVVLDSLADTEAALRALGLA